MRYIAAFHIHFSLMKERDSTTNETLHIVIESRLQKILINTAYLTKGRLISDYFRAATYMTPLA